MTKKKSRAKRLPTAGLVIGASQAGIREARAAIMEILRQTKAGDAAKIAACNALSALCEVKNVTITNNSFST